jgi:hypothetical protein
MLFDEVLLKKRLEKVKKEDLSFFVSPIEESFLMRQGLLKNALGAQSFMQLHWVNDVQGYLKSIYEKLNTGDPFQGCFVGGESLNMIKIFFMKTELELFGKVPIRFSPMIDGRALINLLSAAKFCDIVVDKEIYEFEYDSFDSMILDLRASGQTNALLGGSTFFPKKLYAALKERFNKACAAVSFEIIYWSCFKR